MKLKRCTWARNDKKRIVWRCISRLEFGTDYCRNSPTLDENRLHGAVVGTLNECGTIRGEVKAGVLELAGLVHSHGEGDGINLLELKQRLDALTMEAWLERRGWKADYIVTHCGPTSVQAGLSGGLCKADALTNFLDEAAERRQLRNWFLGHYHTNIVMRKKFAVLYEQIFRLKL